jgi:fatty-acyl-CoA synthase
MELSRESYAAGELTPPLLEQTIGAAFEATVRRFPDGEALVEIASRRRWTWAGLNADVDRVARGLLAAGIAMGDRVGMWAPNCAEWTIVQLATAKVGAILVNVNPSYRTHELAYAINQSGMRMLMSATSFKTSDYRAMVEAVREECPTLTRVVYVDSADWKHLVAEGADVPAHALEERQSHLEPHDAINIQYTSGTTGFPKGATLSHRNILNNGYFTTELLGFTEHDRLVIPVPFYHCFGMVMANLGCITHGATMVIPGPGFEPAAALQTVQDERATALYGVPTMFIAEQNLPGFADYDLSTLRTGIMAGSICPVEVMKHCVNDMHMSEVSIAYGPVTGETVERGTAGEFCTRGYSVMLGYWNDEAKTAEAIDADGWMHTGDLAVMREDGYCNIVGRIKDMVIRGGENIYPREIEEFLYTHPDVEDVQVVGVPDEKYGEELCAWIRLKAGAAPLDAEAVHAFATGRLAHYKIPRYVLLVEEFPMTVTGKIRKVEMRERSAELLGL